jgi:uncharacterized membrane protein
MVVRLLNLRRLSRIELLAYSVGLSITIIMLLGLLTNSLFIGLHLRDPLAVRPLLIAMGALISVLCVACYLRSDAMNAPRLIDSSELLTPSILSLSVLPPLAILGTYLFNHYGLSAINMGVIALIAALIIIIGFKKQVPKNLYPFALWTVALALVLRNSLVSNYIWGTDINYEYYVAHLVILGGFWNINAPIASLRVQDYNIMLGTVILAPVLSNLMGTSLQWIFKIVYPLIFSFVPLVLYVVFKKQTSDRIAFCAAALIIASFSFYTDLLALPRQEIAELFLALLFLLIINTELASPKREVLLVTFGSALVLTHYSLSYIFIYLLLFSLFLLFLHRARRYLGIVKRWAAASPKTNLTQREQQEPPLILEKDPIVISAGLVFYLIVLAFTWYHLTNAPLTSLVHTGQQIWGSILLNFFSPSAIQPLEYVAGNQAPLATVTKYLYYLLTFLGIFGLGSVLFERYNRPFRRTYIALSIAAAFLLVACVTLPNFAASFDTSRFYQFAELLLAPFVVVGIIDLLNILYRALSQGGDSLPENTTLSIVAVFLAVFLLFNSGFVYTLSGENITSYTLLATNPNLEYPPRWTDADVAGAAWLHDNHGQTSIYSPVLYKDLIGMTDEPSLRVISGNVTTETLNSYVFVGALPVDAQLPRLNQTVQVTNVVKDRNQIFSNGDIRVYY